MKKLRIAMIASFPASVVLSERYVKPKYRDKEHASSWVRSLCSELVKFEDVEFRVFVLSRAVKDHRLELYDRFEIEFIPKVVPTRFDLLHGYFLGARQLAPFVDNYKPDIIHGFGFETGNAVMASFLPYPTVAFIQGIMEEYYPYLLERAIINKYLSRFFERFSAKRVSGMVAESEFAANWARKANPDAAIAVIPHALNPEFLKFDSEVSKGKIFLTIGTIDSRKGMEVVIMAFARIADNEAELRIGGDGHLRAACEEIAKDLGVDRRVKFLGRLRRNQVIEQMSQASVFVLASKMDTSPNVVSEAHAMRLPVVATNVGGIPDMIDDARDGFLVDADDDESLSKRMADLIDDPGLCRQFGENGREKAEQLNSPFNVAKRHIEFWNSIIVAT